MQPPVPSEARYALKISDGLGPAEWLLDRTVAACFEQIARRVAESERDPHGTAWSAAVFLNAQCVSIVRYYPQAVRARE
jgi:hypothetical protein